MSYACLPVQQRTLCYSACIASVTALAMVGVVYTMVVTDIRHCLLVQVRHLRLPDTRNMYGSTAVLNRVYGYERKRLNATLREMLFRNAPSARR